VEPVKGVRLRNVNRTCLRDGNLLHGTLRLEFVDLRATLDKKFDIHGQKLSCLQGGAEDEKTRRFNFSARFRNIGNDSACRKK